MAGTGNSTSPPSAGFLLYEYERYGMSNIDQTLLERGTRYGSFNGHSKITQGIKRVMVDSPNWEKLRDEQKEALEMVAHKIGRILNGDPDYHDSWHDIVGYTKLIADDLEQAIARHMAARVAASQQD